MNRVEELNNRVMELAETIRGNPVMLAQTPNSLAKRLQICIEKIVGIANYYYEDQIRNFVTNLSICNQKVFADSEFIDRIIEFTTFISSKKF